MKIGVAGCMGRVGSLLVQEVRSGAWDGIELAGGTTLPGEPAKAGFFTTTDPEELFEKADAVIDFTSPKATVEHARLAAKHKKILVAGTTGLSPEDEKILHTSAKETKIIYAANMSLGVNLLLALVQQAAAKLGPEWDIEIFETHHKHKVDAPSGTALALGKAAQNGRGKAPFAKTDRSGLRKDGEIGFSVARGGDVVGDHRVSFYGEGERIELSHIATNRTLFARGAIKAALWAKDQKPGLYSLKDVLGL